MRERNLTLTPHNEKIDSCTACGKTNYKVDETKTTGSPERILSNGVQLYKLNANGWCTKFCPECLQELNNLIFPFRTGI